MLLFFLQECIKLIKSDSKDIYNVIKDLKKKKIWILKKNTVSQKY